ncbi:L-2-hydroxyglutarate oxidase [Photobacterium galatheae]|uniref:Hydroxyglutarate oxidase n=1 Tax=Photobacterium galatheae TaxID=1654360 RepID=A0A066RH48_9GAMM|nr:L-2-hydroxyglutarate oxidase [Photobacterium galatheae]KDM89755.1 hydroxyglutarate oxidase [Photobacterium galatheae]MCM0151407.1 L-2-hydroxyglutarate oxidase [Photobacterium galatheae]
MSPNYDYLVIGGGIVGVATACELQRRYPDDKILLIEKESQLARHQTGHNSGVIHAGVYYTPGSLKARFCKEGVQRTLTFCEQHDIPVESCGKLLVATNKTELSRMAALFERCKENGIDAEQLDAEALRLREPQITGLGAIFVPSTSIVDYRRVTEAMAQDFQAKGGQIALHTEVTAIAENDDAITLTCRQPGVPSAEPFAVRGRFLVSCGGLMADRLTRMLGLNTDFQIIPYRGEYYRLAARHNQIVRHLIYPIPDPDLPFLGVHLTRMIDGSVTVGPNAVQGWKREGYGRFNFSLRDCAEMLSFPGFWQVTAKHLKTGLQEFRDAWWKAGYLKRVRKYCPSLVLADLEPYPAGVRAQAVLKDGTLVHDFLFADSPRSLHVCNAPSPAATSAMPIADYICDKVAEKMPTGVPVINAAID